MGEKTYFLAEGMVALFGTKLTRSRALIMALCFFFELQHYVQEFCLSRAITFKVFRVSKRNFRHMFLAMRG